MRTTIVKIHGTSQPYDEHKVYASVYAACLSVRTPSGEAEVTAKHVTKALRPWLRGKPEVTSHDIRLKAAHFLHTYNPHAAYLYKQHGTIH